MILEKLSFRKSKMVNPGMSRQAMRDAKKQRQKEVRKNPTSGVFKSIGGATTLTKSKAKQMYHLNDEDLEKIPCETVPNTHPFAHTQFMQMYAEKDLKKAQEDKEALKRSKVLAAEQLKVDKAQ